MPKEELALLSPLLLLSGVLIPLLLSPYTSGPRPLDVFLRAFPARLLLALPYALLLPLCTRAYRVPGLAPLWFRLYLLFCVLCREIMSNAMFVAQMAFFARVSDPRLGGTYMTLLNTVSNLGGSWVKTASLGFLDYTTVRQCKQPSVPATAAARMGGLLRSSTSTAALSLVEEGSGRLLTCGEPAGVALCGAMGGACQIVVDGYAVQLGACCVLGVLWFAFMKRRIERLQDSRPEDWLVPTPLKRSK
jgi:PAT family acetyl-CoA transporter-like MFS transporter 1